MARSLFIMDCRKLSVMLSQTVYTYVMMLQQCKCKERSIYLVEGDDQQSGGHVTWFVKPKISSNWTTSTRASRYTFTLLQPYTMSKAPVAQLVVSVRLINR